MFLLLLCYVVAVKVYRKTSPDSKITVYLGTREIGDSDPLQGVVMVDSKYLEERKEKLFAQLATNFRFGREEDEILGLHFSRQLFLALEELNNQEPPTSKLQQKLIKKFGPEFEKNCFPFSLFIPENSPPSVTIQKASEGEPGAPLGVEYELSVFTAANQEEKPKKKACVKMTVRKVQYAKKTTFSSTRQPSTFVSKGFMLGQGKLNLEVNLDRELYFHGDSVDISISVSNLSRKTVRAIKVSIIQQVEVPLVSGHYSKTVACIESRTAINPGASTSRQFQLTPSINRGKRGVALDGDNQNLSASTLSTTDVGITVSYIARVKLMLGAIAGDVIADVPFKICNPLPLRDEEEEGEDESGKKRSLRRRQKLTRDVSTDLIFEDFRRQPSVEEQN